MNGKPSGITTYEVNNGVPTLTMWYGDKEKQYHDPKNLLNDSFFDGKSLAELSTNLNIEIN
ncbi:hypothetical protein FC41_GL000398 [Lactobacillus hominis DSM 23910 = CRBIP 24.179]|nr:hypothetical protein FC41_GL000398 [Lactobacillus hominis DSM 23910 = CRBIP 24.179]